MKNEKIIIIEDNIDHAYLITDILKGEGVENEIVLVRNGIEAIECFKGIDVRFCGQIDDLIKLIILDLNLPKIDGINILKFLKRDTKFCNIPVVIISITSDDKTVKDAYKNGADEFIIKPFSYEEFIIKLKSLKKYYAV